MSVQIEVWGEYGLFSRPEFKSERCSYDVITPSAARGLIEAVYYHPGLKYTIDKIYVMNPIQFTNIRRNEVSSKISAKKARTVMSGGTGALYLATGKDIQQRAAMVLKNLHYVIEAHFDMTGQANASDNPGKFQDILKRRLTRGACFSTPYFGTREFPANFRLWSGGEIPQGWLWEMEKHRWMQLLWGS